MSHSDYSDFDQLHNVKTCGHYYQFYKSEDDYLRIMLSYFKAGLESGDACLWLVADHVGIERAEHEAREVFPQYDFYRSTGQLDIRSAEAWYLHNGVFSSDQALANAEAFFLKAREEGFVRVRGAGDSAAIPRRDRDLVWLYEKQVHELVKSFPFIVLCAYPIHDCSISDTRGVLECHDGVLVGRL